MAHHVEPMDVDCMDSDFDNKENTFHHSNVLPCTEKGYEELDVSELNMKLRYSMTPASSPMSKSYTAYLDNRNITTDDSLNSDNENASLTRSLNSTMTKNDSVIKSLKSLPLQSLPTEQFIDGNGNASVLRQLDSTITNTSNIAVIVSGTNDIDENVSLPSSSSSALHTPEATTPTKEMVKDGGSPIMRGLKSVLNMFRPSQSPIPPEERDNTDMKQEVLMPADVSSSESTKPQAVASTPIAAHRTKEGNTSKRSSPLKDSIVFNDDLEKELSWKNETTILFSHEKIPVHKLFFQQTKLTGSNPAETENVQITNVEDNFNSTVEYMDISCNDSMIKDRTTDQLDNTNDGIMVTIESDNEFLDCETTFSKDESHVLDSTDTIGKDISITENASNTQEKKSFESDIRLCKSSVSLDATGISVIDEEYKNDETEPSDYSNYSKETTKILYELDKFEENVISTLDLHFTDQGNTTDVKEYVENDAKTHEIVTNATVEDKKQTCQIETIESHENTEGSMPIEEKSTNIMQPSELELFIVPETVIEQMQYTESLIESNNKNEQTLKMVQNNINQDNMSVTHNVFDAKDSDHLTENIDQKKIEATSIQDLNSPEFQCLVDSELSKLSTETSLVIPNTTVQVKSSEIVDITQNNITSEELDVSRTHMPADVPLPDDECSKSFAVMSSEPLNVPQNFLRDIASLKTEMPADIPLPDEDDIDKEVTAEITTSLLLEAVEITPSETGDVICSMTELDISETILKGLSESNEDKIRNDNIYKSLQSVPADDSEVLYAVNTELENLMSNENRLDTLTDSVIGKKVIAPELSNITSPEMLHPKTSELPTSDIIETESIPETKINEYVLMTDLVSSDDKTITLDRTTELVTNEHFDMPQIIDVPQLVTKTLDTTVTKECHDQTENKTQDETMDITLNETFNQTHDLVKITPQNPSETLDLQTDSTDVAEVKKSFEDTTDSKVNKTIMEPEVVTCPNNKTNLDKTTDQIDSDMAEIVNDAQSFKTILETTITNEHVELGHNKTQDMAADIAINESLNQTHDLHETLSLTPPKTPELQTSKTKSDIIEIKNPHEDITQDNVNKKIMLPEVASCPNTTFALDQTSEQIVNDMTQVIDDSQSVITTLDTTFTNKHVEQAQNKAQVEPMDITINESFNQPQSLPDLVNQTIIMDEEKLQNVAKIINTVNVPNVELAVDPGNEILTLTTMLKNDFDSNLIKESESVLLKSDVSHQAIVHENQNTTFELPTNTEINTQVNSEDVNLKESVNENKIDDQHNEVVAINSTNDNVEVQTKNLDEEIIVSGNNSPYVSLMAGIEPVSEKAEEIFEEIINPFVTNTSCSPPITSKGYNFNFDEMDDPFATNLKIRTSPPPDTSSKPVETGNVKKKIFSGPKKGVTNKQKSQPPQRKTPGPKKLNATVDNTSATKRLTNKRDALNEVENNKTILDIKMQHETSQTASKLDITMGTTKTEEDNVSKEKNDLLRKNVDETYKITPEKSEIFETNENKSSTDSTPAVIKEARTTSSSEQSVYYSAGASSVESSHSKNVFNLPEIDDVNFNPFATKSKMRQSPQPDQEVENPFATKTKIRSSPDTSMVITLPSNSGDIISETKMNEKNNDDKMETEPMEKETFNTANVTSSSHSTDHQNMTTREVNTEDEDTIEGPFLEADDFDYKITDFNIDNADMMQFKDLPTHEAEDNAEGELFIDAEAYEFLLNQNQSNVVADSGKESLFLKFDPLFAKKISSDGVRAALAQIQKRQSTPTKPAGPPLRNEASPIAGPSTLNVTYEGDNNTSQENNEDVNITVSKPMMVVTPAVNPAVTPRNKSVTPTRSNRRSITFTSPAIAVIDRLLSMSANNSLMGPDTTMTHVNREQIEANQALSQLRELLAEKEISVYNLRSESKELKDRLSNMESQVRILEADGQVRLKKIKELNERLVEKTQANKRMAAVVEEYERTIASLISETEQDKKRNAEERIRLINERDEQTAHLASMEVSFSDLHSKYEKSKQIILACKTNEDTYKKSIKDIVENLTKMQTNYEMLKQHATSKLNHANQELEKLNRAHEAEVIKLNAMLKRKDLHITSLEETLAHKTKANEELTAICDELINKVG